MRSTILKAFFIFLVCILSLPFIAKATHLRAGEIVVERVSCSSLTFRITVTVFTNTIDTPVLFGGEDDWLDFGDGIRVLVPETQNTLRPDLGEGIATASYTITHTYSGYRSYVISYSEPNRNKGVVNMDASVNTKFYIESRINVDPFLGCNNTPKLLVPPIDRACTGVAFYHNPGAYDPDGDSLSYELVVPFRERGTQVINYKSPIDTKFYPSFQEGNEEANGPPTFGIDARDGTLTWNAPGSLMAGEYNIAFIVVEWRKVGGQWRNMGFVRRDMQIIVEECDNQRPDLIVPDDVCVVAGTTLDATIFGIDENNDDVKIEAYSEIFNFASAQSPATYSPNPPVYQSSVPPAELQFEWNTNCSHVKEQPYQVVFKITDKPANGPKLVTFKTWFIRVVGPEPEWVDAQTNLATRSIKLEWDEYVCDNAEKMQIWRRVDSFAFTPDSCETGMPDFLGYSLIETVPLTIGSTKQTEYTDTNAGLGVADGAQYCYRLVALYPFPKGGESYVSDEICVDPIRADAPVITNVTIDKTSATDGQITVRWTKPFDIDRTQYPGPFEYEVYQAEGFAGNTNLVKVNPGRLAEDDTTLVVTGGNTRDIVYNYRIVLWSNTSQNTTVFTKIDTSFSASTVRLEANSDVERITLNWSAFVPWSNLIKTVPNQHELYRGPAESDENSLQLLAAIDPAVSGFTYVDEGLSNTEEYCYRVKTRGAYGNPKIKEPLENFSQIICAQPNDTIPPCKPVLMVQLSDCNTFLAEAPCSQSSFSNTLYWQRPEDECAQDILGYKVYRASQKDGEYIWLQNLGVNGIVRDTTVRDNGDNDVGLNSLAYCYRIASIDLSKNESELSDPVCNDNCVYYELPNVFSPNADNCNDTFGAWRDPSFYESQGEEGPVQFCGSQPVESGKCARFVEAVAFRVYNRWGKEVYNYKSGSERSIYIDWDGRTTEGSELAAGIYYYVAEVTFLAIDPDKRNQIIKGWVHLVR